MAVTTLPVKRITLDQWALIVALYNSFTAIETYPQVATTVTAEIIVPTAKFFISEEKYL